MTVEELAKYLETLDPNAVVVVSRDGAWHDVDDARCDRLRYGEETIDVLVLNAEQQPTMPDPSCKVDAWLQHDDPLGDWHGRNE